MPTAIYKINRRFDYCDADTLRRYLMKIGVDALVETGYPSDEIRITSNAPASVLNDAVDRATMKYCDECTRRLKELGEHLL